MPELTLTSPAKINLYLKVLSKREDGYHNIETVMQKIDLCDTLFLKKAKKGIKIFCGNRDVPLDKNNLCYQAADLLLKDFSLSKGVEIFIEKKIPIAAGLGGGSSNAANTFLGLNKLWNLNLEEKELMKIGGRIGADVPFFISSFLIAKCKGRGDKLSLFHFSERVCYLLVVPDFFVSAKDAYSHFDFLKPKYRFSDILMINDLESAVVKKIPLISDIKQEFKKIGVKSAMSGSGPTVFGIFKEEKEVIEIEEKFRKFGRTYICLPS